LARASKTIKEKYPDSTLTERMKLAKDTYVKAEKPKSEKLTKKNPSRKGKGSCQR